MHIQTYKELQSNLFSSRTHGLYLLRVGLACLHTTLVWDVGVPALCVPFLPMQFSNTQAVPTHTCCGSPLAVPTLQETPPSQEPYSVWQGGCSFWPGQRLRCCRVISSTTGRLCFPPAISIPGSLLLLRMSMLFYFILVWPLCIKRYIILWLLSSPVDGHLPFQNNQLRPNELSVLSIQFSYPYYL